MAYLFSGDDFAARAHAAIDAGPLESGRVAYTEKLSQIAQKIDEIDRETRRRELSRRRGEFDAELAAELVAI